MIAQVLRLTRWEFFKVRKRWMPWILLAVAVAITQLSIWGVFFSYGNVVEADFEVYHGPVGADGLASVTRFRCAEVDDAAIAAAMTRVPEQERERVLAEIEADREHCPDLLEEVVRQRHRLRQFFVLPDSISNGLAVAQTVGVILIMILAASAMGGEYGWGTLRTALTRGIGRWQFLKAKALSVLLLAGLGLLGVCLAVAAGSLIGASLISEGSVGLAGSGEWSTALTLFGKTLYAMVPYAILALFLAVLTSSASMGISISLAYYFVELILVGILTNLFDWFSNVSDFLLGPSIVAWMTETGVQATGGAAALFPLQDLPSQLHAFLALTAYIAVLGGAALWLFQRKDIAGARGE